MKKPAGLISKGLKRAASPLAATPATRSRPAPALFLAAIPVIYWFLPINHVWEPFLMLAAGAAILIAVSYRDRAGRAIALLLIGLSLMAAFWFTLFPFQFLFPELTPFSLFPGAWAAGAGVLFTAAAFAVGGEGKKAGDINSREARLGLVFILGVGCLFRLWRYGEPHPTWGYDPFWELMEARNTAEIGYHRLIYQLGSREPFFNYLLAFLWRIFPESSPYVISRAGSLVIDLGAVWFLYLIGKELAGRRAGLIAAALGAASKPMLIMTIACTRGVSATLASALVLFLTLRLFRRPELRNFLWWGAALGASAYTYTGIRIFLVWIVLSVLARVYFILVMDVWKNPITLPRKVPRGRRLPLLMLASSVMALSSGAWIILGFFKVNGYLNLRIPGLEMLGKSNFLLIFLGTAIAALILIKRLESGRPPSVLGNWFLGMLFACLAAYPLMTHPYFSNHLEQISIFTARGAEGGWAFIPQKIQNLFTTLFIGGGDRYDLNIQDDSFLEPLSIAAVLIGLAGVLAQPGFTGIWLVLTAAAGFLPHALSEDPHSVKLMSGLPALLALAAVSVDKAWGWFRESISGRIPGLTAAVCFGLLWLACLEGVNGRLWGVFARQLDPNGQVVLRILREPPKNKVYLAQVGDFFLPHQYTVQLDGRPAYLLNPSNDIDLAPGEPAPTVVIFFCKDEGEYPGARAVWERLAKAFPGVPWEEIPALGWGRNMWRMELQPALVEKGGGGLFHVRRVMGWQRKFFFYDYGLGRGGLILREEIVADPFGPLPAGMTSQSCRTTGVVTVPREGKVKFEVAAFDRVRLKVGGRTVLDHRPFMGEGDVSPLVTRGNFRFSPGTYPVEMMIHMKSGSLPVVRVTLPGEKEERILGRF